MIIKTIPLVDACILTSELYPDKRGGFELIWSSTWFKQQGFDIDLSYVSLSSNHKKGTLRGLHYQRSPHSQAKLIRCIKGCIFDVIIDLRVDSPTYLQWYQIILCENEPQMLYIPSGFAHGFQTLADESNILYHIWGEYCPEAEQGIHWQSPGIDVPWPIKNPILSPKDEQWNKIE